MVANKVMENRWFQDVRRTGRLLVRHIRFFRPWQRENRAKMRVLDTLFKEVNRYLRSLGGDYWLAYGTLLGYYRNRRILAHDSDVDFGAHEKTFDRIWDNRGKLSPGFKMYDTSSRHRGPKLYIAHKGWEADIYFYEDAGSHLRSYEQSRYPGEYRPFPKAYVYPLETTTFLGSETRVPCQTQRLLGHHYGYIGENAVRDKETGYWYPKHGPDSDS